MLATSPWFSQVYAVTIQGNFARVSFEHFFDFRVYVGVFYIIRVAFQLHTRIRFDFYFRLYGNDGGHNHFVFRKLVYGNVRIAHNGECVFLFVENFAVVFGEEDVQPVFIENALAVCVFDNVFGGFAFAEAVHRESAALLDVRFVLRVDPFVFIESERNFYGAFFSCFGGVLHSVVFS